MAYRLSPQRLALVTLSAVLLAACPSGEGMPTDVRRGDGSDVADDIALDGVTSGDSSDVTDDTARDGSTDSAVGHRCDSTHPCPSGFLCRDGTCHIDCGSDATSCGSPERCCAAAEVCVADRCVAPGAMCSVAPGCGGAPATCPMGSYCDAVVGRCLPSAGAATCTLTAASDFRPTLAWEWHGSTAHPEYRGVLVTPIVADVNHDGASDVLVVAYRDPPMSFGGTIATQAILCALSGPGDCMGAPRELWCTDPSIELDGWANIAVADLDATDGMNRLTVIAATRRGALGGNGIVAFDETGARVWMGRTSAGATSDVVVYAGGIGIADLDADGHAEVFVGGTVFDSAGAERWSDPVACGTAFGPHALAVDLDVPPDGRLEIVCGNIAFNSGGGRRWTSTVIGAGHVGAADFDGDGATEIVVVASGTAAVLRRDGTAMVPATNLSTLGFAGTGGPPTIADVDRDGRPDIGIAGSSTYGVFRVVARGTAWALERLWSQPADDLSSQQTGSAMFDFDGDGVSEVIYQDTCRARVFRGNDGMVLMDIPNISGTATNYPTVADLNGDGRAEFILVTDSYYARSGLIPCPASTPRTDGVRVFRDANDNWQATRAIWNQHTYHVTNVCDGVDSACDVAENVHGGIPRRERPHWASGVNAFRVNRAFRQPRSTRVGPRGSHDHGGRVGLPGRRHAARDSREPRCARRRGGHARFVLRNRDGRLTDVARHRPDRARTAPRRRRSRRSACHAFGHAPSTVRCARPGKR